MEDAEGTITRPHERDDDDAENEQDEKRRYWHRSRLRHSGRKIEDGVVQLLAVGAGNGTGSAGLAR